MISYFDALLYGAVQGVTEYLPVSSSAHLILLPKFLGEKDPGLAFDVFLHLGTLLATVIYFWRDWMDIFHPKNLWREKAVSLKWIVVATLPALVVGAALHGWISTVFRSNSVLVLSLSIGGILLFWIDRVRPQTRNLSQLGFRDALWVGLLQCLALVPGVSRSGSTMVAGRLRNFDRSSAARFSFLISAPVTAAAIVFECRHWKELFTAQTNVGPIIVAGVSSFLFGMLAIGGLLRIVKHASFLSFAVYRVILALIVAYFL